MSKLAPRARVTSNDRQLRFRSCPQWGQTVRPDGTRARQARQRIVLGQGLQRLTGAPQPGQIVSSGLTSEPHLLHRINPSLWKLFCAGKDTQDVMVGDDQRERQNEHHAHKVHQAFVLWRQTLSTPQFLQEDDHDAPTIQRR